MAADEQDRPLAGDGSGAMRSRHRSFIRPAIGFVAGMLAVILGIVSLWWLHDHLIERSYHPNWYRWVAPGAVLLAVPLLVLCVLPNDQFGRRRSLPLGLVATVLLLTSLGGMLVGQRGIVCGETAHRVLCAAQLKSVGQALIVYSLDHAGQLPASFSELVLGSDVTADYFACPIDEKRVPPETDRRKLADLVMSHSLNPFIYHGAGTSWPADPQLILVTESLSAHGGEGMNVLYGDGRVEYRTRPEAIKLIAELQAGHNPPRAEMLK